MIAFALCAVITAALRVQADSQQSPPQPLQPRSAVPEVPGAHGDLPVTMDGVADGPNEASAAHWRWTYLDPTPVLSAEDTPFPYRYGVADRDDRDRDGGRFIPALRYAHVSVATDRALIVSHGYHYALGGGGGATWLSDTWSFCLDSHRWRRLHAHISHPALGPVARYAAVGVLVAGDLFMHGGDDGGNAQRLPSYKHSIYGDLWRFVLRRSSMHSHALHSWVRVRSVVAASPFGHASHLPPMLHPRLPRDDLYRSQHAAVLVPLGSQHELHRLDSDQERDGSREPLTAPTPYLFASHGLATYPRDSASPAAAAGDLLSSSEYDVVDGDELFVFSFRSRRWRQVRTTAPPPPRFGHALVYVPEHARAAGGDSQTELAQADQPRGSIFLYGGLSRSGLNHGDLWSLSLHSSIDADGTTRPAFVWAVLHVAYAAGSSASPGRRGYHSFLYTPDRRLHLFGGARCEPGCVCSAESWLFDLDQYAARSEIWARKLAGAKRAGIALSPPRPGSPDDPSACWSMLLPTSPHSPASRDYPARGARGGAEAGYTSAEESVKAGWPVHRYKQSMSLRILPTQQAASAAAAAEEKSTAASPATPTTQAQQSTDAAVFSMLLFGGESYNPAAYFHDVWRFDYTHALSPSPRSGRLHPASLSSFARLQHLLHLTPFEQFEVDLPAKEWIEPQPFCVHAPPGADRWGLPPKQQQRRGNHELAWRSAQEIAAARARGEELDGDALDDGVAPVGFLSLASPSTLSLVASLLVSLLLLLCFALCRCFQRREKIEKKG